MLKSGFAHADITPPANAKPTGSYRPRAMVRAHDPLLAVACVIDDGKTTVALVGIDVGVIHRETADAARALIERHTGIPRDNIIISASHTHQGGASLSLFSAVADGAYANQVSVAIADAVLRAWQTRADCELASGSGKVSGIHFNRRFLMRDGRHVTHPGKMNPDIVAPAGPVDDKVSFLAMRTADGKITGIVVNFGCHCTVTEDGNEYSADYVHYIREHLTKALGPIEVVFLLGACGDVTQIDNQSDRNEKGHRHADMMGATLATEITRQLPRASWTSTAACGVATQTTPIAVRDKDAAKPPSQGLGGGDFWEPMFAAEAKHVEAMRTQTPNIDGHITAIKIGDLAIAANGAELFAQASLDIQRASPFVKTWVVTLANEYLGYVPTASAHYAGGYEPRLARSSFLAIDAAQKITEASLRALHSM
jgi:neutral ceramidase